MVIVQIFCTGYCGQRSFPSAPLIDSAIIQMIAYKTLLNHRPSYLTGLRQYLTKFAKFTGNVPVSSITQEQLRQWFAGHSKLHACTLGMLGALFTFCLKQEWIEKSPVVGIDLPRVDRLAPEVFTVEQCRFALDWTAKHEPRFAGWLALALFCGVRPEELDALPVKAVKGRVVDIPAEVSKVRLRRTVPISVACRAWLKAHPLKKVGYTGRRRWIRRLRVAMGLASWPRDVLRHTAASYMLAQEKDAAKVSLWLGNSPKILQRHYVEVVSDGAAFWRLRPGDRKVVNQWKKPVRENQPPGAAPFTCTRIPMLGKL